MTRPTPRRLIAATALALVGVIGALGTSALADNAAQVPAAQGWARFGHFAPSVQSVDVAVDGQPFATDIAFKSVSEYLPLAAGIHRFELRPTGGDPTAAPLLSVEAAVPADGAVTVGAVTTLDGVAPQIYEDALMTPQPGQASVRFIHSAPDVPAVDVQVVGGPLLASGVPYPAANAYQAIQPGQYDVEVRPTGSTDVLLKIAGWSIQPGTQASIVIVRGLDGQLDVVPVRDSAATLLTPVGGVQTGYGSMAGHLAGSVGSSSAGALYAAIGGVIGILGVGGAFAARRRASVRAR